MLIHVGSELGADYAWELVAFHWLRRFDDGITNSFDVCWDRFEADHSLSFRIHLVLMNFTIVEFAVFYRHHRDLPDG